ncbi:hypothetical protein DL93DRAFT_2090367 [Clavulina sp. PMI_390]|nr:hypothetical protein DL93DRAFT_2090367 [Clavulina sp. PMI_390]
MASIACNITGRSSRLRCHAAEQEAPLRAAIRRTDLGTHSRIPDSPIPYTPHIANSA